MKRQGIHIIIALLFLLTHLNSFGQKIWSFNDCLAYAKEKNIDIQLSNLSTEQDELNYQQSKYNHLPSVNASYNNNISWSKPYDSNTETYGNYTQGSNQSYGVNANVNIFNGFKVKNQIKQSYLELESGKYYSKTIEESVELNILDAYMQILYAYEAVTNSEEQLKSTTKQLALAEERFTSGIISKSDYLQIKSQLASEKLIMANAQSTLAIAKVNLMQIMELPVSNSFNIVIPNMDNILETNEVPSANMVYEEALGIKPQIKEANLNVESAMLEEKIVKADLMPSIDLSAGLGTNWAYSSNGATYLSQINNGFTPSVGLSLSIPIFQKNKVKTNIKLARVSVSSAQLYETQTKNTLRKEIEQVCVDMFTAISNYNANIENYEAINESYMVAQEKYEQGLINSTDFLIEKTNAITAKSELIQSKYNLIFSNKILDFYKGKPLTL